MRLPSTSPITLRFGATTYPYSAASPHFGTDFAHTPDNKIYAPFSGTVILIPNNGRDGNGIYMYNGNQFHGMLHSSHYLVANGAKVKEGQPIGIMGDTGYAFGMHLHWCVKVDGAFINPISLIKESDMQMTVGVMDSIKFLATRQKITDPEVAKYQNDLEGFVQYLTTVQAEHNVGPVQLGGAQDPQVVQDADRYRQIKQLLS